MLGVAGLVFASSVACSEAVRLESGGATFAAGWLFVDAADGLCRLATPRHVALRNDALVDPIIVVLPDGRRVDAVRPFAPDSAQDLAFYEVNAAAKARCTPSRLGIENLARTLADTRGATLVSPQAEEVRSRPIRIHSRDIDQDRGATFVIRLADDDAIAKGMSGSTIIVGTLPLGMLLHTSRFEPRDGVALRFDAIRQLFRAAVRPPAAPQGTRVPFVPTLLKGRVESDEGLSVIAGAGAVRLVSENDVVELELTLPASVRIDEIRLSVIAPGAVSASVRTAARSSPERSAWTFATRCQEALSGLSCRVGRTIGTVRVRLNAAGTLIISGLELR